MNIRAFLFALAGLLFVNAAVAQTPALPIGPGGGSGGGNITAYASMVAVAGASVPPNVQFVSTAGYTSAGDGGDALYVRSLSLTTCGFQSVDGSYWRYVVSGDIRLEQCGGKADWNGSSGTDNFPVWNNVVSLVALTGGQTYSLFGPRIKFLTGYYYFSQTPTIVTTLNIDGNGNGMANPALTTGSEIVVAPGQSGFFVTANSVTTGAGTIIQNIGVKGMGGSGATYGFWCNERCEIDKSAVDGGFTSHGINIVAFTSGSGTLFGNVDSWSLNNDVVTSPGGDCLFINGDVANAGSDYKLDCLSSGAGGIVDNSFLGNAHYAPEFDSYDTNNQGTVSYSGQSYELISLSSGIGASTTPGTNSTIWYPITTVVTPPAWSASGVYVVSAPYWLGGASATGKIDAPYCEQNNGILAYSGGRSLAAQACPSTGGTNGPQAGGSNVIGANSSGIIGSPFTVNIGGDYVTLGGIGTGSTTSIMVWSNGADTNSYQLHWVATDDITLDYAFNSADRIWYLTGLNTTATFGRSSPVPLQMDFPQLAVGSGTGGRIFTWGSMPPTSGQAGLGDIVFNNSVTLVGNAGWICTTAGTNGAGAIWSSFGQIYGIAPTISSGFGGGSPTISTTNGALSFDVTIGTASGSTGVLTMPAAPHAWNCTAQDVTTQTVANAFVLIIAHSSTSVTVANYSATMTAATWVSGDDIALQCAPH